LFSFLLFDQFFRNQASAASKMSSKGRRRRLDDESDLPAKLARTPTNIVHSWRGPAGDISDSTAKSIASRQLDLEKTNKYLRRLLVAIVIGVGVLCVAMLALNVAAIKITQNLFAAKVNDSAPFSLMTNSNGVPISTVKALFSNSSIEGLVFLTDLQLENLEQVQFELAPSNTAVFMRVASVQKMMAGDVVVLSPAGEQLFAFVNKSFAYLSPAGVHSDVFSEEYDARKLHTKKRSHKPSDGGGLKLGIPV